MIRYFKNEFEDEVVKADLYGGPDEWEERSNLGNGITFTRIIRLEWMGTEITKEEFYMCKMSGYEEVDLHDFEFAEYHLVAGQYDTWNDEDEYD